MSNDNRSSPWVSGPFRSFSGGGGNFGGGGASGSWEQLGSGEPPMRPFNRPPSSLVPWTIGLQPSPDHKPKENPHHTHKKNSHHTQKRSFHTRSSSDEALFPPRSLSFSADAIALLKSFEKLYLYPYSDADPHTPRRRITVWKKHATIGYGHLILENEWEIYKNGISQKDADALFDANLEKHVKLVQNAIHVNLNQHQFDALVIFSYNGGGVGPHSSVVRMINDPNANTGYESLEDAWKAYNKQKIHGQLVVRPGLINRRAAEWNIYANDIYENW